MTPDLDKLRGHLEHFSGPSEGGWLIDQPAVVTAVVALREAGLVDARLEEDDDGVRLGATVFCVTPAGYQFLEDSRDGAVWNAVKERCGGGGLPGVAEALFRVSLARGRTAAVALNG